MLIKNGLSIRKLQRMLDAGIVVFVLFAIFLSIFAYISLGRSDMGWDCWITSMTQKKSQQWEIPRLEERKGDLPFPNLSGKLVILEHTPRPDAEKKEGSFLLGLEGGGEKRLVSEGEKIFLNCLNDREVRFSSVPTPFWVDLSKKVLHIEYLNENKEVVYAKEEPFQLAKVADFSEKGELLPIVDSLAKAKLFEPDRLLELYGGDKFKGLKSVYRMVLGKETFFIKPGDRFVFRGGKFFEGKGETKGLPLIEIKGIDGHKCEMVVWDSEGLHGKQVVVPISKGGAMVARPQENFAHLHPRSDTSITCRLDHQSAIVRQGDWFLYTKGNLRRLRTQEEVKEFLKYALKGELFIVDGITKRENGSLFVGHLFNEERTQVKKVEIPLAERKKK